MTSFSHFSTNVRISHRQHQCTAHFMGEDRVLCSTELIFTYLYASSSIQNARQQFVSCSQISFFKLRPSSNPTKRGKNSALQIQTVLPPWPFRVRHVFISTPPPQWPLLSPPIRLTFPPESLCMYSWIIYFPYILAVLIGAIVSLSGRLVNELFILHRTTDEY